MANFLRTLTLPAEMATRSLTSLREKVVRIGAKVIAHAGYTVFQMAEELTKASFPPTGEVRPESGPTGQTGVRAAPDGPGRAGSLPKSRRRPGHCDHIRQTEASAVPDGRFSWGMSV
jgi:hypothetical protein